MAQRFLKLVVGAFALANSERPSAGKDALEIEEQSQTGETRRGGLGFCGLKVTPLQGEQKGKKTLAIEYLDPATAQPEPNKYDYTSAIDDTDSCAKDTAKLETMQVWPEVKGGHACEKKCKEDMERYKKYHDRLIQQAKEDEVVDDALRTKSYSEGAQTFKKEMQRIHQDYEMALKGSAHEAVVVSQKKITEVVAGETEGLNTLKKVFKEQFNEFWKEPILGAGYFTLHGKNDAEGDSKLTNDAHDKGMKLVEALTAEVEKQQANVEKLYGSMKDTLTNSNQEFSTKFKQLNEKRVKDDKSTKDMWAEKKNQLNAQKEAAAATMEQLNNAKDQKALPDDGEAAYAPCNQKACCCTVKLEEGEEAMNVKVGMNFLNSDICQFPQPMNLNRGPFGGVAEIVFMESEQCASRTSCDNDQLQKALEENKVDPKKAKEIVTLARKRDVMHELALKMENDLNEVHFKEAKKLVNELFDERKKSNAPKAVESKILKGCAGGAVVTTKITPAK